MLTGSLTKCAAPCQVCACQAQAETEEGLDLAMVLLGVWKSCAFTHNACKDKDAYIMALQPLCVRMFPRMFWLPLSKRGILPGKLLLSKSPAVILTNEPWKSEEVCVCVCVCLYSHVCLRIRACGFLLVHEHSTCTIRMTYRWLVYKRI